MHPLEILGLDFEVDGLDGRGVVEPIGWRPRPAQPWRLRPRAALRGTAALTTKSQGRVRERKGSSCDMSLALRTGADNDKDVREVTTIKKHRTFQ